MKILQKTTCSQWNFLKKNYKMHLQILNPVLFCFVLFFPKWMVELLLNVPEGVWVGRHPKIGRGRLKSVLNQLWSSWWMCQDLSCLCRFHTNHVNWKLERGSGHNQPIYHPKGWAVHKFNLAKELENRIDAYKNQGQRRGAPINNLLQPYGWQCLNIFYLKLLEIWKGGFLMAPGWSIIAFF